LPFNAIAFLECGPQTAGLFELKAEGGTVSGTVHFYEGSTHRASAPIESGSFNKRTATLRLTGGVTDHDGRPMAYVIEGTLREEGLVVSLTVDGIERGSQVLCRPEEPQAKSHRKPVATAANPTATLWAERMSFLIVYSIGQSRRTAECSPPFSCPICRILTGYV
jgi:hypothetical protein